jgi:hypothetical protein
MRRPIGRPSPRRPHGIKVEQVQLFSPEEPRALKEQTRTLLEQSAAAGFDLLEAGDWIAEPLWQLWGDQLMLRGMAPEQFRKTVVDYRNEMRLWLVGERTWEHAIGGLIGRINRRVIVVPCTRIDVTGLALAHSA